MKIGSVFLIILVVALGGFFLFNNVTGEAVSNRLKVGSSSVSGLDQCPYDIYFPRTGKNLSAIVFSPGALGSKEDYRWIGRMLSDEGYVVFIYTPLGKRNDDLMARVRCISVGIDYLIAQNNDGRFKDRIDENKIGVIGHSEGGGAAIIAAVNDPRIKTLVGLAPYTGGTIAGENNTIPGAENINCSAIMVSTLFVSGGKDVVIASSDVESCYNNINIIDKSYVSIPDANHFSFCSSILCRIKARFVPAELKSGISNWLDENLKKA